MRHSQALILALLLTPGLTLAGEPTNASDPQQGEPRLGTGGSGSEQTAPEADRSGTGSSGEITDQRDTTGQGTSQASPEARPDGGTEGARQTFLPSRTNGDVTSDELVGSSIVNAQGEQIGDIKDILIGDDGRATAVVVGVGGFLGLGERSVAIAWDELEISRDGEEDGPRIRTDLSREDLEEAPEFDAASTVSQTPADSNSGV